MSKEPTGWITVNGNHIPLYDGKADITFMKGKQVQIGKKSVGVKQRFPNKRIDQKDLTDEKIMKELAGEDSYVYNDEDYKIASFNASRYSKEVKELNDKEKELNEALKQETSLKPQEEWNDEDELTALILGKRSVVKYTEKGQQIKEELDSITDQRRQLEKRLEVNRDKVDKVASGYRQQQIKKFNEETKDDKGINHNPKNEYPGFKLNESTTSNVDNALAKGDAHVVGMSPKRYIQECAYNIFQREGTTLESVVRTRFAKDVGKYMTMMEEGVKFDTPYLNYRDEGQEGLHRAVAAYMLGMEEIPVIVVPKRR